MHEECECTRWLGYVMSDGHVAELSVYLPLRDIAVNMYDVVFKMVAFIFPLKKAILIRRLLFKVTLIMYLIRHTKIFPNY